MQARGPATVAGEPECEGCMPATFALAEGRRVPVMIR